MKMLTNYEQFIHNHFPLRTNQFINHNQIWRKSDFVVTLKKMNHFLTIAFEEAEAARLRGEVPVGAVLVYAGTILARDGNRVEELNDPTAHAEMLVLRAAARQIGHPHLLGCDLYVTLEPCSMCASAISLARIRRLYFGAYDPQGGGVEHGARVFDRPGCRHRPEIVGGLDERRAAALLRDFFRECRSRLPSTEKIKEKNLA